MPFKLPSSVSYDAIRNWTIKDVAGWMRYVRRYWQPRSSFACARDVYVLRSDGGEYCDRLISAMRCSGCWQVSWVASYANGCHVFAIGPGAGEFAKSRTETMIRELLPGECKRLFDSEG